MKELSIEEKAKRYDEAIKIARDSFNYPDYPGFIRADVVFPELKESEDEKIRKVLIDYFNRYKEQEECGIKTFYGIPTDDILAWLENQGNPTDINPSKFDLRLNKLLKQFESLPKEELASCLSFYLNVVQNDGTYKPDEEQGEQGTTKEKKPKKDQCIGCYYAINHECAIDIKGYCPRDKHFDYENANIQQKDFAPKIEQNPTDIEMVEALRTEYEKGRADAIVQMQKEWNEEDETKMRSALAFIKSEFPKKGDEEFMKDTIAWLKSFKPRKQWKPSDEQINALDSTLQYSQVSHNSYEHLNSLYNDLKKLTE